MNSKPFWMSKTLWGAVATFLGVVLPALGVNVEPTELTRMADSWVQFLDSVLTFGGLALTIYGRLSAKPAKLTYTFRRQ